MSPGRWLDRLWMLPVVILLLPVVIHAVRHSSAEGSTEQGRLILGRAGLDSLLAAASGHRPVLVNFWATWCTPCVAELPHIDAVRSSLEGGIEAVAVDIGDPDPGTLLDFREEVRLSMPVVWLDAGEAAALKEEWDLPDVLPVTVLLSADGAETARALGSRSEAYFREIVDGAAPPGPAESPGGGDGLHIVVVGASSDSLTAALLAAALALAGEEGVDRFDPALPADRAELEARFLPLDVTPYAQPCIGSACGRLARSAEELAATVETLTP